MFRILSLPVFKLYESYFHEQCGHKQTVIISAQIKLVFQNTRKVLINKRLPNKRQTK